MNIRPIGERLLVEELRDDARDQKTASGILLPESASQDIPKQGRVVALGEGRRGKDGTFQPFPYKEGDTILYTSGFSAQKVKKDGNEYELIRDDDVLGIVQE